MRSAAKRVDLKASQYLGWQGDVNYLFPQCPPRFCPPFHPSLPQLSHAVGEADAAVAATTDEACGKI